MGFPWFDRERKATMGIALAFTVVAILITGFGCFALSSDPATLHATAGGVAYSKGEVAVAGSNSSKPGQISYVGLRRFVVVMCDHAQSEDYDKWSGCEETAIWWHHAHCESGQTSCQF